MQGLLRKVQFTVRISMQRKPRMHTNGIKRLIRHYLLTLQNRTIAGDVRGCVRANRVR
jgi:hypothetical protein